MNLPTRGEKNNNPGNIRISSVAWRNKLVPSLDKDFEQFPTPFDGLHALAENLMHYYKVEDLTTISEIVGRWAPSNENNTQSYVADVCHWMAVNMDDPIILTIPNSLQLLMNAIIMQENGRNAYPCELVEQVVNLVLA